MTANFCSFTAAKKMQNRFFTESEEKGDENMFERLSRLKNIDCFPELRF
jgi:hypothetical protein